MNNFGNMYVKYVFLKIISGIFVAGANCRFTIANTQYAIRWCGLGLGVGGPLFLLFRSVRQSTNSMH